jgi:hypothetical protein
MAIFILDKKIIYKLPVFASQMDKIDTDEKLRAIDIEIKRTKNKIKFMEKQLFQNNVEG